MRQIAIDPFETPTETETMFAVINDSTPMIVDFYTTSLNLDVEFVMRNLTQCLSEANASETPYYFVIGRNRGPRQFREVIMHYSFSVRFSNDVDSNRALTIWRLICRFL